MKLRIVTIAIASLIVPTITQASRQGDNLNRNRLGIIINETSKYICMITTFDQAGILTSPEMSTIEQSGRKRVERHAATSPLIPRTWLYIGPGKSRFVDTPVPWASIGNENRLYVQFYENRIYNPGETPPFILKFTIQEQSSGSIFNMSRWFSLEKEIGSDQILFNGPRPKWNSQTNSLTVNTGEEYILYIRDNPSTGGIYVYVDKPDPINCGGINSIPCI